MNTSEFSAICKTVHTMHNVHHGYKDIIFHPATRTFDPEEEAMIETTWNTLVAEKKVRGNSQLVALYPDKTIREESELHVTGYKTDYKHYKATLEHPYLRVWLTGPSAVVRVFHDNTPTYIFGERKNTTTNTGGPLEFVPGGFLEAAHFDSSDPFMATLEDELEEETGIPRAYISKSAPFWLGQVRNHYQSRQLSQDVCVDYMLDIEGISPKEIEERFQAGKREHTALHFIPESQLLSFAERNLLRFNTRGRCSLEHLFAYKS